MPVRSPVPTPILAAPAAQPNGWEQPVLGDAPRDCRHASSLDPPRDPRFLHLVLRQADVLAECNSWPPRTLQQVRRGLRMIAGCHGPGEPVRASAITAMSPHGFPGMRVLEVFVRPVTPRRGRSPAKTFKTGSSAASTTPPTPMPCATCSAFS